MWMLCVLVSVCVDAFVCACLLTDFTGIGQRMSIVQDNQLYWDKIHYVPKQLKMKCSNLFTNRNSRHTQAIVPRSAISTRFECLLGYKLSVLQIHHKLPVLQIHHKLAYLQTYHKLPILQIYNELPALQIYQLPVLQIYQTLPVLQIQGIPGGRSIFWEVIVSVILSKNVYMNMCPVPNGFRDRAI